MDSYKTTKDRVKQIIEELDDEIYYRDWRGNNLRTRMEEIKEAQEKSNNNDARIKRLSERMELHKSQKISLTCAKSILMDYVES